MTSASVTRVVSTFRVERPSVGEAAEGGSPRPQTRQLIACSFSRLAADEMGHPLAQGCPSGRIPARRPVAPEQPSRPLRDGSQDHERAGREGKVRTTGSKSTWNLVTRGLSLRMLLPTFAMSITSGGFSLSSSSVYSLFT